MPTNPPRWSCATRLAAPWSPKLRHCGRHRRSWKRGAGQHWWREAPRPWAASDYERCRGPIRAGGWPGQRQTYRGRSRNPDEISLRYAFWFTADIWSRFWSWSSNAWTASSLKNRPPDICRHSSPVKLRLVLSLAQIAPDGPSWFRERGEARLRLRLVRRRMHENADAAHSLALLRARRERPRSRGAWLDAWIEAKPLTRETTDVVESKGPFIAEPGNRWGAQTLSCWGPGGTHAPHWKSGHGFYDGRHSRRRARLCRVVAFAVKW